MVQNLETYIRVRKNFLLGQTSLRDREEITKITHRVTLGKQSGDLYSFNIAHFSNIFFYYNDFPWLENLVFLSSKFPFHIEK